MGTDFIQRVGKTLKRSRDEERIRLASPDLTTRELVGGSRGIAAIVAKGIKLAPGQPVTLEVDGDSIVARQALTEVARHVNPPKSLLDVMAQHCNILPGLVNAVYEISGTVEIVLSC